ncbi:MAG: TRAP transporter large permease subunit [Boseongicola sp. SB0673_bin_14]|nr:TRAP transporter large permease subunit [Boseongicola sp. SB0673_bin_14]
MGVPALQAHFFVFYFAVFSTLSPPVAVSVLAAAKLANSSFLQTAGESLKIAMTTFIIPFAFVYSPELMAFPNLTWDVVPALFQVLLIQWSVSVAAYGHLFRNLARWERCAMGFAALCGFLGMTDQGDMFLVAQLVLATAIVIIAFATRKSGTPELQA